MKNQQISGFFLFFKEKDFEMDTKMPMTRTGYEKMQAELQQLKFVERHEIIAAIEEARSHGDLSENAEYHAARERQSFVEGRIQELENAIGRAQIINVAELSGNKVLFGATVQVSEDESKPKTYQIVGQHEADLEHGRISLLSPLARALIGKEVGDFVDVATPGGTKTYEILNVQFV